jgi:hypothetical protein
MGLNMSKITMNPAIKRLRQVNFADELAQLTGIYRKHAVRLLSGDQGGDGKDGWGGDW